MMKRIMGQQLKQPTRERFYSLIRKTDDCWLFGSGPSNRYGTFNHILVPKPKKRMGAHRFSWILHFGAIPEGLCVCHRCDVKACVRPDHLFLGTISDNSRDMWNKGRAGWQMAPRYGERATGARLTEAKVKEIRTLANSQSFRIIAQQYGISVANIYWVVQRKSWAHVT